VYQLDLDSIFDYHPADTDDKMVAHANVRFECRVVAERFLQLAPECPERTLAIRHLQEAMHMANSAIAQHGPGEGPLNKPQ